jgi:negative regulator of replication initiation
MLYMKNVKRVKIVKVHEEDYLYVIKHAGYNESFADTLRRLLKKNGK